MGKIPKDEPRFKHPPRWIHASEAGNWMLSRREARKRAVIQILDRLPLRAARKKA